MNARRGLRGNTINLHHSRLRRCVIEFFGTGNVIEIESSFLRGVRLKCVGNNCRIVVKSGCTMSRGGELLTADGGILTIGENCSIGASHFAALSAHITIGSDCLIADATHVVTSDGHAILDATTRAQVNPPASITIGNRAWLARECALLKGAIVANDSVVGFRSLVTAEFTVPNTVLAGTPARVVRTGVEWKDNSAR